MVKSKPNLIKGYVIFGVILELGINSYFVYFHEVGAFLPTNYIKETYPSYTSLITNCKFEGNYFELNHKQGDQAQLVFMTHDPPFVKHANP